MSLKKALAGGLIAVVAAVGLTSCGSSEPRSVVESIEAGRVILGTKFDQPGLGLRHPDKEMSGLDVDVATFLIGDIAERHNLPMPDIVWRETPSSQRETLIKNGEVDMITATYSINKGRSNAVNFAGPYLITEQALLVRADDENAITDLEDLRGRKLCSASGSTPAQNVKAELPEVQLQEFDSYSSCVEALYQGKVDALTTDATILSGYSTQYPSEFSLVHMTKLDGTPFSTERYGIGLAKDDAESTAELNESIQNMIDSGKWDEFIEANLGTDYPKGEAPEPGDLSFLDN